MVHEVIMCLKASRCPFTVISYTSSAKPFKYIAFCLLLHGVCKIWALLAHPKHFVDQLQILFLVFLLLSFSYYKCICCAVVHSTHDINWWCKSLTTIQWLNGKWYGNMPACSYINLGLSWFQDAGGPWNEAVKEWYLIFQCVPFWLLW